MTLDDQILTLMVQLVIRNEDGWERIESILWAVEEAGAQMLEEREQARAAGGSATRH